MNILDIGCGLNKTPGAVGLDQLDLPSVDIKHSMREYQPLPLPSHSYDRIILSDIIEHVDNPAWLLSEAHRVGKPHATVWMRYPHYSSRNAYNDSDHKRYLGVDAFDHFIPGTRYGDKYQYYRNFGRNFAFSRVSRELTFKSPHLSRVVFAMTSLSAYEGFWSKLLPITAVVQELQILKNPSDLRQELSLL